MGGVFVALLLFVLIVLAWPRVIVNPTGLKWAASLGARFGYKAEWESVQASSHAVSLLHHGHRLAFHKLCITLSPGALQRNLEDSKACFENFDATFETAWHGGFKVPALGPVNASGGDVFVKIAGSSEDPKKKEGLKISIPNVVLPGFLKETVFQPIDIDVPHLSVSRGEKPYAGAAHLSSEVDVAGRLETVGVQASVLEGLELQALSASLRLWSKSHFTENDWVLDASADARQKQEVEGQAEVELSQPSPGVLSYKVTADARALDGRYQVATSGMLTENDLQGKLTGSAKRFLKPVQEVSLNECPYHYRETSALSGRGKFDFDCPIRVDMTPLQLPSGTLTKMVTLPYSMDFLVRADLETDLIPTPGSKVDGHLNVSLVPFSRELFDAKGSSRVTFSGVPSEYPKGWQITADSDVSFLSKRFQKIAQALERTAFAVPAPFNALDGLLEFRIQGRSNLIGNTGQVPVTFRTRLKSQEQDFNTDGKGELVYRFANSGSKSELTLELQLAQVKLSLPRFGFSSLPTLFLDSRIQRVDRVRDKSNFALKTHFKIKTVSDPVRLVSNVAQESIPITLDVDVEDGKLSGTVEVGATTLNLFRKHAQLDSLKITLHEPLEASEVAGHLRAIYTDYRIDMYILGTVRQPQVVFESVPPLSEEQMVAAVLYGQPFGDLDTAESSAVANTSAALAQKSVALGSLFLLASTPVESVSYNPETGAFSAKVRLSAGTLLNVTTQEQKQQLGIRRTISGNWVVNTYIENDNQARKQRGVALFEWMKRY